MPLNSTTGLVILALVLVAGWLLGLASSTGGKKWKARYVAERDAHAAERDAHAAYRKDADARVADSVRRHADLERDHARAATATPVAQPVAQPVARPVTAQTAAHPADVHTTDVHAADAHRGSDRPIPPISSTVITPDRSRDRF